MTFLDFTGTLLAVALLTLPAAQAQTSLTRFEEPTASFYEAHLTGASAATQRGSVHAGTPKSESNPTAFVISLSSLGEGGAVILTWADGGQPGPGTYPVSDQPIENGFAVLVVTGSTEQPGGAFRAEQGTVVITESLPGVLAGRFELDARGFLASDVRVEDRRVSVTGSFATARPVTEQAAVR